MNTYDGLGYALSSSAKIVLQDPNKGLPTYMSINEVSKGTYKLTYDIANMNTDLSLYVMKTMSNLVPAHNYSNENKKESRPEEHFTISTRC